MPKSFVLLSVVLLLPLRGFADRPLDYTREVKPILAAKCYACHGALRQESGLRLDAAALIRRGGDGGPVIVGTAVADSELLRRVAADEDERMPPPGEGEPLTAAQMATLRGWIAQGAMAPEEPIPADPRLHWSYQQPRRPGMPQEPAARGVRNEIDALLAAEHRAQGLVPAAEAPKSILLRRVYFDLIGLPPTREELRSFLDDDADEAYERVVDRLLDSPQYGERWGRHWMDVWRYSDWTGFGNEIRYSQRHIWRWRDWIVESLNADKGYDRMILEMLAADELIPQDDQAIRATGFLARNWYKFDRDSWLDDTIEHTCKALLAMTMKCARCHDHKYDPLSQREYYQLRSIFEPYDVRTDQVASETGLSQEGLARVYDAQLDPVTYLYQRGDPKQPDKSQPISPAVPSVLDGLPFAPEPQSLPLASYYPALRDFVVEGRSAQQQTAVAQAEAAAAAAQKTYAETAGQPDPQRGPAARAARLADLEYKAANAKLEALRARVAAERAKYGLSPSMSRTTGQHGAPEADHESLARAAARAERQAALAAAEQNLFAAEHELALAETAALQGDVKAKEKVMTAEAKRTAAQKRRQEARQAAEKESSSYAPLGPTHPQRSSGRRLAFARWIVDPGNPLTARVAVNHIWLRHFGRPLVDAVDDFGLRSPRPQLAELLDFLALELIDHGWRMKSLHRLIVTSAVYRMQSTAPHDNPSRQRDRDNTLFWRMNPRRLEAEAVRDSLLYLGGNLDLTLGGPELDHQQGQSAPRRSLYFRHARERQVKFLQLFDAANPRECYRRETSIRPQQVYALVNSSLALAESRRLAKRLAGAGSRRLADREFITVAFETMLTREPTAAELSMCRQFLQQQAAQLAEPARLELLDGGANPVPPASQADLRARENLVLVLFNHNDFITVR